MSSRDASTRGVDAFERAALFALILTIAGCGARSELGAVDPCSEGPCSANGASIVLFGGSTDAEFLGDTWEWKGSAWTDLHGTSPSARLGSSVARLVDGLVLFGGTGYEVGTSTQVSWSDTWAWRPSAWSERTVSGPSPRNFPSMATLDGKIVLFGGCTDAPQMFGDTWEWDGSQWTERHVPGPSARCGAAMATLGNKVILFGGTLPFLQLDDTWQWDGSTWTELPVPGPSARGGHAMVTFAGKIVLFGGESTPPNVLSDTWEWDGSRWTQRDVAGPSGRDGFGMATLDGQVVLFGGFYGPTQFLTLGDTWGWDGSAWTELDVTGPSPRGQMIMGTR